MVEDVLEQVVDDWLRRRNYFTRTNVRFGPTKGGAGYESQKHNQPSDLDVLAVKPSVRGPSGVYAVSCKAMQEGFSPNKWLETVHKNGKYKGRQPAWKHLREVWDPVWAKALGDRVEELTGRRKFTFVLAVTCLDKGGSSDTSVWMTEPKIRKNLHGPVEVWTFAQMWTELVNDVKQTIEPSHVGRLAQLLRASGLHIHDDSAG